MYFGTHPLHLPSETAIPDALRWLARALVIPAAILVLLITTRLVASYETGSVSRSSDVQTDVASITDGLGQAATPELTSPDQPRPFSERPDWLSYSSHNVPFSIEYPDGWTISPATYTETPSGPQETFFIANPLYMANYNSEPLERTVSGAIKIDVFYTSLDPSNAFSEGSVTVIKSFRGRVSGLPAEIVVWQDDQNMATGFSMRLQFGELGAIYCSAWMGSPGSLDALGQAWNACESIKAAQLS